MQCDDYISKLVGPYFVFSYFSIESRKGIVNWTTNSEF